MRKYDLISGLFLLFFSITICLLSVRYKIGTFNAPNSGFFPLLMGIVLGVLSILILVEARKKKISRIAFWAPKADKIGIFLSFVFVLLYALLIERIGFIATTAIFFFLFSRFISHHGWVTAFLFGVIASFSIYILFTYLLYAPLPRGLLEGLF